VNLTTIYCDDSHFSRREKPMSRKTLLTETQIRQFMKLANLSHVSDNRLSEMGYGIPGARDEDEELEAELGATEDELGAEDALAGEEGGELDDLEGDLGAADLGAEEGGGEMVSVDDFMSALESALEDVMGEPTSVEMDAGEEEVEADVELPGGDELEVDAEEEIEEPMMEAGDSAGDDSDTHPGEKDYTTKKDDDLKHGGKAYVNEDEIVAEVSRRVAARLSEKSKKDSIADQLAERIFNRITAK
jgi:hypothetical protein